jgi:hypothetical protein
MQDWLALGLALLVFQCFLIALQPALRLGFCRLRGLLLT